MGDDRRLDIAISAKVIHALMNIIEQDYIDCDDTGFHRFLARCGLLHMTGYLGSLRGQEILQVVKSFFYKVNEESLNSIPKPCVLPLYDRFKNEKAVSRCFIFCIVCRS